MSDTQDATHITELDVVGDVHGCFYELVELVEALGYVKGDDELYRHPEGRTMAFVGDITDRGWANSMALQFVLNHWEAGEVLWCMGNHDNKLFRWMKGNPVRVAYGLQRTVQELQHWPFDRPKEELGQYLLDNVPTLIEADNGRLLIVHAYPGLGKERFYGPLDQHGRISWWKNYKGPDFVIFGHYWLNDPTVHEHYCCVDTSCVKGETLAAIRWPEREIVQVEAHHEYYPP